ncbi:MAG: acyl--CoA ligase [Gammaproteobacteria bacterium]|nr:acyl--CoA ligase [Gammaproteobacteria bacterium]
MTSLLQLFVGTRPDSQPLAYRGAAVLSWQDFRARVAGVAAQLSNRPETSWALCSDDAYHFICGFFGAVLSGKRVVIPPNFQPGTLASLTNDAQGWIVDRRDHPCPAGARVVVGEMSTSLATGVIAGDAAIDLYTSGTTGTPKRIRKNLLQLAAEIDVLEQVWGETLATSTVVGTVPHHHIYGLLFRLLWPLAAGRPFDVMACSGPDELLPRLRQFGRAVIVSSPAQLSRLPELMDLTMLAAHARLVFSSGGPLSPKTAQIYRGAIGCAPTEVYGSSETGGIGWRIQTDDNDGDAWTPLPRVAVRRGDDGALHVRSPFAGADAELATADAVDRLADGRFRLRGRLDRVVKIEEKRLSLTEMEERLRGHPWVRDAGVVPVDGARRLLGAVVALTAEGRERLVHAGKRTTSGELKQFLGQYYELPLLPRRWRFPEVMPLNERGKVSSALLLALLAQTEP